MSILMWTGSLDLVRSVVPEGLEDVSLETDAAPVHVQVKSRRPEQPPLTQGELATHLCKIWPKHLERLQRDAASRVVLVLERHVDGWPDTGWQQVLADDPATAETLRAPLAARGFANEIDRLLESTSIVVPGDMEAEDLDAIARGLGIDVPGACQSHLHELRIRLGTMADENGVRAPQDRARMTLPDMQALLDSVTGRVDVAALSRALSSGICQHVDFGRAVEDDLFYEGVDVVPGHVGAGLVLDRPELVADVVAGLDHQRSVLIIGPSGSGKSALAWLSALHTREEVLWYRVSRLLEDDVPLVLRLLDASVPRAMRRIGLVVDGLGRPHTNGWDRLVSEVAHRPHVCMVGTIRHEDVIVVESAASSHQVRPQLDEPLASSIFERLVERGGTQWADWREPFSQSRGLLLEYTHILTVGHRLETTIRSQVAERLRDPDREDETRILRLIATAHTFVAAVPLRRLNAALGLTDEQIRRPLVRLVEEHVIRITGDVAEGLHELRSRALMSAAHDPPPPTLRGTIDLVFDTLEVDQLQAFIAGVLDEGAMPDRDVLERIAIRLTADPSGGMLTAVARALRTTDLRRNGRKWVQILREVGVSEAIWEITVMFAITGQNPFQSTVNPAGQAIQRLRAINASTQQDLREALLQRLPTAILADVWKSISSSDDASMLLEAFRGLSCQGLLDTGREQLQARAADASVEELARLLAAVRGLSADVAIEITRSMGGDAAIEHLFLRQIPWLERLRVAEDETGQVRVEGDVLLFSTEQISDPHEYVVKVCRLALDCFPAVDVAAIRAVDPAGESAGFRDFVLAEKQIPRVNLPAEGQVELNRERIQAFVAVASQHSRTERLTREREVLSAAVRALQHGIDEWLRDIPRSSSLESELQALREAALALPAPDMAMLDADRPKSGSASVWKFAIDVANNLLQRLFDPAIPAANLLGFVGDGLRSEAEKLCDPEGWEPLSKPPISLARQALRDLTGLHAILTEVAAGGKDVRLEMTRMARRAKGSALDACAGRAHRLFDARIGRQMGHLVRELRHRGYDVMVAQGTIANRDPSTWPPVELAVLVRIDSLGPRWQAIAADVVERAGTQMGLAVSILVAPVRDGKVVASEAARKIPDLFPAPGELKGWGADLPLPLLNEERALAFAALVGAIVQRSALLRLSSNGRATLDAERRAVSEVEAGISDAETAFAESLSGVDPSLAAEVVGFLKELLAKLEQEGAAVSQGGRVNQSVASEFTSAVARSSPSPLYNMFTLLAWALIESSVAPDGAIDRVLRDVVARQIDDAPTSSADET